MDDFFNPANQDADVAPLLLRVFALADMTPKHLLARPGALAVGALVARDGEILGETYSGADHGLGHAEELLFKKLAAAGVDCTGGTLVTTHEPCNRRNYPDRVPCAQLAVTYGIARVVFAHREDKPPFQSVDYLRSHGVRVVQGPVPTL